MTHPTAEVTAIEIVEDYSATARCDEGYLQLRRLRCKNRRADGTSSSVYRVDVVDRPKLDAVAVLVYRRVDSGVEVLTRQNLRPAAYFRKDKSPVIPDPVEYLHVEEIVAGVLELADQGEQGIRLRAAEEVFEEAGYRVTPESVRILGGPFFVTPGILSEKIHITCADVTGLTHQSPQGDGSPLEEGGTLRWYSLEGLLQACRQGQVPDAKTEIALTRFRDVGVP
jgi:ADP-ribose pyrophosphatase